MSRVTIFAKGNLDVRDSLHALKLGGMVVWNGVGDVVRAAYPGVTVRVKHETWSRSDALVADGAAPDDLERRNLPLGAYTVASQFSRAVFEGGADAVVLSVQPDLTAPLARHREEGWLFYPHAWQTWPAADRAWLARTFRAEPLIGVKESMSNLAQIIGRIRAGSAAPILIYNVSAVVPGDRVHSYAGLEETFATRIRRFNLALVELSRQTGVSIVDVDAIVARGGADTLKHDAVHLTPEGCRRVAEEVVRILADYGLFERIAA